VKVCKYILFFTFLVSWFLTGEIYAVSKPRSKAKNSCTISRAKFTVSDQIEYRYGVLIGQNIATIKSKKGASQDIIPGLMGGLAVQVAWPKGFVVQPEILYSQKGCMFTGSGLKYDIDYLEVPIKAMYRLHMAEVKPFVFAAAYGAYALRITENGDVVNNNQINKLDYGVGAGAGFDFWKIQLSFKYTWGFAQVANETFPIRNKVFTISAGLFF
jgi:hypothetical protein